MPSIDQAVKAVNQKLNYSVQMSDVTTVSQLMLWVGSKHQLTNCCYISELHWQQQEHEANNIRNKCGQQIIQREANPKIGWGCSSVGRASDRHVANAGSIPRCSEGFFSQSQLSVHILLRFLHTPVCNSMHRHLSARERSCSPCQSSADCETPSKHRRLGSVTLLL